MSASGRHALAELWTELNVSRIQKERCAKEIDAIKISCLASHGKNIVSECKECYSKVIDVLQARYCGNESREWFSTRKAFVYELGVLFADCKDGKIDLQVIEDRIESEKEAWYRWVLRMHPEFLTVADSSADPEELRAMLDDPDKSREQLIEKVWEGVGKPADWENSLDSFVKEFEAAKDKPEELKKLYISKFFLDGDGNMLPNAKKYLDGVQNMNGEALMEIIDKIAQDEKANKSSQPQRDRCIRRLDELRRAKAAFEQTRALAKARRLEAQSRAIPEELYNLPPCSVCGSAVDPKNVTSCTFCQAMKAMGGPQKLTIYCSVDCMHKGYDDHAEAHLCSEGEKCGVDEDETMGGTGEEPVVCNQCIEDKTPHVWCSMHCAYVNMPRHQDEKHGRKDYTEDFQSLISPFKEVMRKKLEEANPGVKFRPIDE